MGDARKVLALPSVTNVLGVLAKPGLDAWKIEQGIMAALTLPRRADEPLDVFAHRVVQDMGEQVEKAADFGSAIHAACEVYALNKQFPHDIRKGRNHEWLRMEVNQRAGLCLDADPQGRLCVFMEQVGGSEIFPIV